MGVQWQKYSTQIDPGKLEKLKMLAKEDDRQIRTLIDDALDIYLRRRQPKGLRPDVLRLATEVMSRYPETMRKLAE